MRYRQASFQLSDPSDRADRFPLPAHAIQWCERADHEGVNHGKLARWLSLADQALQRTQPIRRKA